MEFQPAIEYPTFLENEAHDFRAEVKLERISDEYEFYGNVTISKLGDNKIVPAHTKRVWSPSLGERRFFEQVDVPQDIVREVIESYATSSTIWMSCPRTYMALDRINGQLAKNHGVMLGPQPQLRDLISPIVENLYNIREGIINPVNSLTVLDDTA